MSNEEHSQDMTVFIQLVTESIKTSAGLTTKVDNIAKTQERQDTKLDGLIITMAEVKTLNSNLDQRQANTEKDVVDHEARLRVLEVGLEQSRENRRRIEELEKENKTQRESIDTIKTDLTRYVAVAGTILLIVQTAIAAFVIPWIQSLIP